MPSSTGLDRFAVKGKSKGKQSKKCRPFPLNGYLGVFSEKNRDLKNRTLQPRRVARTSVLRSKTLAQGGFIPPCAFPITHGFQKEKTRKACLFFLEVTPRFELPGRLSCGVRSCSHALFFKAFVLLRGMRWRRQIIGVGEKIGGNFAAAKEPLQLAAWRKFSCVWGPAVFAVRESNFPKWGRAQGYRRAQERAAVRPRLDGLRASLAIFSALFFA